MTREEEIEARLYREPPILSSDYEAFRYLLTENARLKSQLETVREAIFKAKLALEGTLIEDRAALRATKETTMSDIPQDRDDQFTTRIKAAHPIFSEDADRAARYALAMEMIHSRHSKYALADLVNWLLTKWPELQKEITR